MDILDILLDILLKPPQPFIGLFFMAEVIQHAIVALAAEVPVVVVTKRVEHCHSCFVALMYC